MKKESIKDILECSGSIEISYKKNINNWYSELKISKIGDEYIIQPFWQKFSDIDEAVNWFMDQGLTSKNKGYIQTRLMNKGLLNEGDDIEGPSKEVKKLFKEEGKLVDQEAKLLNIIVKPFPTEEDFNNDLNSMIKNLNVDNLKDSLIEFKKKYITLDPYISLCFVYDTNINDEFISGFDFTYFSREFHDKWKTEPGSVYKHMRIITKLKNTDFKDNDFKNHDLNF